MYKFIYSIFEAISTKISEHHEANPGFDSGSPVESPSGKHVFVRVGTVLTLIWSRRQSCCGGVIGHLEFKSI